MRLSTFFKRFAPKIDRQDGTSGSRYSMTCSCGCVDLTVDAGYGELSFDEGGWFRSKKITCRKCKKVWYEKRRVT